MTSTTVLFHGHCPDGIASAFAAWQVYGETATYIPVSYGRPCPEIPPEHHVLIADFSYDAATLTRLLAARLGRRGPEEHVVTVLDHHASAQRNLTSLMRQALPGLCIRFDLEESGASLTWKHLNRPMTAAAEAVEAELPTFFKLVRDRDLWRFALPNSRAISMAYRTVMMQPFSVIAEFAQDLDDAGGYHRIVTEGEAMLRYGEVLVAEQAGKVFWVQIGGYRVPCANATTLFSEVGEYLCQAYPAAPFAAYVALRSDGQVQWGLRGRGTIDLSQVATQLGGGGHHDAAGFLTSLETFAAMRKTARTTAPGIDARGGVTDT